MKVEAFTQVGALLRLRFSGSEVRVGAFTQVGALLRLRFSALGDNRRRVTVALALLPLLAVGVLILGMFLPAEERFNAQLLMSTAWLGFLVTAVVATAGSGSRTLLPRAQTVVFPLTAAAEHLGALVLSPLNIAWLTQTLALLTLAGWAFDGSARWAAIGLTVVWIVVCTVIAQAAGWLVELARTTRSGPWLVRAVVGVVVLGGGGLAVSGHLGAVLDDAPTRGLVISIARVGMGRPGEWVVSLVVLTVIGVLAYLAGGWLAGQLQRRAPRDVTAVEARDYPARTDPGGDLAAALRIDHASVWRSAPLRRGLVVLTGVPALACAAAGLNWSLAAILPGLVVSGAGLLFGVNALSLDGPGALWRESLPGRPRVMLVARLLVIAEICLAASVLAAFIGALRAPEAPTVTAVVAVLGAVVSTTAQVVARCATWSVLRPYAAALRDARDQPAPPGAMAGYSMRLALGTTATGLLFSMCVRFGLTGLALAATVAITALAARRILRALRWWDDDIVRSRIVSTVAG